MPEQRVSINTIKENLLFYLEKILDREVDDAFIYNYMPYIIINSPRKHFNDINYSNYPLVKLVLDVKNLQSKLSQTIKFSEAKEFIRNAIAELPKNSCPHSIIMLKVYIQALDNMKQFQMDKMLLESAMLDYSVVAPYSQVLTSPDVALKPLPNSTMEYIIDTLTVLSNQGDEKNTEVLHSLLIQNIESIVKYTNEYIVDNNNHNGEYNILDDGSPDMLSYYVNRVIDAKGERVNYPLVYYFLSYIMYNFESNHYTKILNYLTNLHTSTSNFPFTRIENVEELVAQYEALSLPELSSSILSMESVMNMEYEKDKELEKIYDLSETTEKKIRDYNIDVLLSYLYTNRRYQHNHYTNALFTSKFKSVNGYSYYNNDILVCEIDDTYLATPVSDLGDDYKLKLICLNTDNQVIVKPF